MGYNTIHTVLLIPPNKMAAVRSWLKQNTGGDYSLSIDIVDKNANSNAPAKYKAVRITCSPEMYTAIKNMLRKSHGNSGIKMKGKVARDKASRGRVWDKELSDNNVKVKRRKP